MVLYRNAAKNQLCVFAEIKSVTPGKGRARGWKHSVVLAYTDEEGSPVEVRTDFWNEQQPYKDTDQPRLLSEWVSRLSPGDHIVCLLDISKADVTATAMVHDAGVLLLNKGENDELCIIVGMPKAGKAFMAKDSAGNTKKAYSVGVALDGCNGTEWRCATFYSVKGPAAETAYEKREAAVRHNTPVIILAKKASGMDDREGVKNYIGFRIWEIPKEEPVLITLGPYRNNPIELDRLVDGGVAAPEFAIEWLRYVAEELEPASDDPEVLADFNRQRDAIRRHLSRLGECA